MAASDFVAEFEQAFRKRVRIGTVAWVVAAVSLFGVLGFGYLVSPGRPTWFLAVVVGDPLITGIAIVPIRKRLARIAKLPRALRDRLTSAGGASAVTLVFDNGLVAVLGGPSPRFYLFGSPGGTRSVPAAREVGKLLRGMLRMRPALRVSATRGPEPLRSRVARIGETMKGRLSTLFVCLPRSSAIPNPCRPSWIASVSFGAKVFLDPDSILRQVDSLAALLEDAAGMAQAGQSSAGAPP